MPLNRFQFFDLKTPADLFRKLESDLATLESLHQNTWIAFNFFITAHHLADWLDKKDLKDVRKKEPILRIVSHIANGAKHLMLSDPELKSVTDTEKSRYIEEGYFEPGYFSESLLIHLSLKEARECELNTTKIDAVTLGQRVVDFWRKQI